MHLAYVDDSGDPQRGSTMTALLVEARDWSGLLDAWLAGRRVVRREFGVRKHTELHATALFKKRKSFCETREQDHAFGPDERAATALILLSHLAQFPRFTQLTVASSSRTTHEVYAAMVARLDLWARERETQVMVFYDGQQGLPPHPQTSAGQQHELWEQAVRNAFPYRRVHRDLVLSDRRVIEDVVMQDSRYSQLIQAVDLVAYGAYQHHREQHPLRWGGPFTPVRAAVAAYLQTRERWLPGTDDGVVWLGSLTQEPPA